MSIVALTSDTLVASPGAGQIEYNGQFYGTDSNASRAQMQRLVLATSQASTSGTSIDFTGLPAWVKRITVMFNGVSTSGASNIQIQLGAGAVQSSGYLGSCSRIQNVSATTAAPSTSAFLIATINTNTDTQNGSAIFSTIGSNIWTLQGILWSGGYNAQHMFAGAVTLSGTLDRVRITTAGGTDTFDAGSINILYEG